MAKRFRFPRSRRLTRSAEFRRVRIDGSTVRGRILTLGVLKNAEPASAARAGFVTSRRIGGAVARNYTRRRLREIFRKHQHDLSPGIWVVTIASSRAVDASFSALEDEWLHLARCASILAL
jgi:ribonuclease P protein component